MAPFICHSPCEMHADLESALTQIFRSHSDAPQKQKPINDLVAAAGEGGVTPAELVPLDLGNQRTTALLNCLLQLKRVRLAVKDGQQNYLFLSAA